MKRLISLITALFAIIALTVPASANSAGPPDLTVIVYDAPNDIDIKLRETDRIKEAHIKRKDDKCVFEFQGSYKDYETLLVTAGGESFEVACSGYGYEAAVILNLDDRTLTVCEPAIKTIPIIALRFLLTLIIEGAVFYLFGYRQKRSWKTFAIVNLITQSALNWVFMGYNTGPWPTFLAVIEYLIWQFETVAFVINVKEKRKVITGLYVLAANLASFIIGSVIIGMFEYAYVF